jgi:hypothetical protein
MRKSAYFILFSLFLLFAFSAFAQETKETADLKGVDLEYILKTRVINPQPIPHYPEMAELFSNGSPINAPGAGPGGSHGSVLQSNLGLSTYGAGWQQTAGNSLADDFEVSGATWTVDSLKVYGYQTGSTTTSTFTGLYVQVYNGDPMAGGTVIWGDLVTNVMVRTYWTGAYRYLDTSPETTRPIMAVVAATPGLVLVPGTYYVEVSATGTLTSGPWMPPITITGQAVTGNAIQKTTNGWAALMDGTNAQGMPFVLYGTSGAPVGPGPATNPSPINGAIGVPITGVNLNWTNPATATNTKLYFSPDMQAVQSMDNSALVYDGNVISTYSLPELQYYTSYYWRVVETDATGTSNGSVWTFKTMRDPSTFFDDFTNGAGNWTITGNAPYVWTVYNTPWPNSYTFPPTAAGAVLAADSDEWGSGAGAQSTTATLTNGLNFATAEHVYVEFDSDFHIYSSSQDQGWVDVSIDGGNTWTNIYYVVGVDDRAAHKNYDISALAAGQSDVRIRFKYANTGWNWFWAIDNVTVYGSGVIPVELTSFAANVIDNTVVLNWATATETNNSGFAVERSSDGKVFEQIAFVKGNGTTTERHVYSYTDASSLSGTYTYRLRQVDFDGTVSYSNTIEVTVGVPTEFALSQNYPNPFNPTTKIAFAIPVESNVTISLYNSLGQFVSTIAEGNYTVGNHVVNVNASSLSSGIYFYKIEAKGVNGKNFTATKKMALMK